MLFIAAAGILLGTLCWMLLSRLILTIDTKAPVAEVRWVRIGRVLLFYDRGKWYLDIRIFFFRMVKNLSSPRPAKRPAEKKRKGNRKTINPVKRINGIIRVLKSCVISRCQISLDTGDYADNAWLHAVYALPAAREHVSINFRNENHLLLQVMNTPLRMLLAYWNLLPV